MNMNSKSNKFSLELALGVSAVLSLGASLPGLAQTANQVPAAAKKSAVAQTAVKPGVPKSVPGKSSPARTGRTQAAQASGAEKKREHQDKLGFVKFDPKAQRSKEKWFLYTYYGDQARKKGDYTTAKRYYLGALTEIETHKPFKMLGMEVAHIEKSLRHSYPDWNKDEDAKKMDPEAKLKLQEEEAAVMSRIYRLNTSFGESGQLASLIYQTHYNDTETEIKKTKETIAAAKAGATSGSAATPSSSSAASQSSGSAAGSDDSQAEKNKSASSTESVSN